ncbi:MAG: hypothetical protein K0U34_07390 [Alphaproteobacteria bacterium]|nr:hypothetical protein [Alphaproteobacteria bacterium]
MTRTLSLTALLFAGFALPVAAADTQVDKSNSAFTAQLSANANAEQVRQLLRAKDYTQVSVLQRDANGRWTGTAVKDGKTTAVSVYLPRKAN